MDSSDVQATDPIGDNFFTTNEMVLHSMTVNIWQSIDNVGAYFALGVPPIIGVLEIEPKEFIAE